MAGSWASIRSSWISIAKVPPIKTGASLAPLLKAENLTDAQIGEVLELTKWAWVELNYRPHAYQACALTT